MSSNALRIVVAVIAALIAGVGAKVGPADMSDSTWAIIGVVIKFVVDFITAHVGSKPSTPTRSNGF